MYTCVCVHMYATMPSCRSEDNLGCSLIFISFQVGSLLILCVPRSLASQLLVILLSPVCPCHYRSSGFTEVCYSAWLNGASWDLNLNPCAYDQCFIWAVFPALSFLLHTWIITCKITLKFHFTLIILRYFYCFLEAWFSFYLAYPPPLPSPSAGNY